MKKSILKIGIVCMLLITLTAVNFIAVGAELVSYAADNSVEVTKTNQENVGFTAYLKDASGNKTSNASLDINSNEMKMYLGIEVKREGYFNGEVKLKDSNFEFVDAKNEAVSKVTSDTISLNQINVGSNVEIEVTIKPKLSENFDLKMLDMDSKVELTGTYKDSTEKDNKVSGEKTVKVAYVSTASEQEMNNKLEVLTNELGMYNGEEKRIVQVSLKTGVKDNSYPVKNITSRINVPESNGQKPQIEEKVELKTMKDYSTNYENGVMTVTMSNEAGADNKINWTKAGDEEIVLTYIYDKSAVIDNAQITADTEITLYDGKTLKANESSLNVAQDDVKSGIITVKGEMENDLYKGNLYAGLDKEYTAKTQIEVNLDKVAETIYVNEKATSVPSKYVRTTINKNEFRKIFGEEGTLEISSNGTVISTITTSSPEDENGNIVIDYPEGIDNITIRTTKAQNKGNFEINHIKTIKVNEIADVKAVTEMKATIDGSFDTRSTQKGTIPAVEITAGLKETTTEARLEVNRDSLATITENKNVEIKATLLSNAENYDLYKNPTIEIEMPADVTDVIVNNITKVYGDEFTAVRPSKMVVNGKQVIRIELEGAQTEYKQKGIDGTEIIINADLILNKKATSKTDVIKMTYTNQNANRYGDSAATGVETSNIEIVSPKGVITTNNIVALDIQTTGEQEKASKMLDKNVEAKLVKVEKEIINNNETPVNNVAILGSFATDTDKNNLHIALKSGMTIEGMDASKVKVYYSENENATADVTKSENAWQESATSETEIKKYLITISDMQVAEGIKLSYDMEIPANLEYNQKAEEAYEVAYTESNTGMAQQVKATTIELTTGEGPVLEAALSAKLGASTLKENQEVKQGEIITYKTEIKNTGTKVAKDVKVTAQLPEGVQVVEGNEQVIPELQPGESKAVEYKAQISKEIQERSKVVAKSTVTSTEASKETNEVTNTVAEGNISVMLQHDDNAFENGDEILVGDTTGYVVEVKNLTNTEQKDLKLAWKMPDELEIAEQTLVTPEVYQKMINAENCFEDEGYNDEIGTNKEITIDSIKPNSSMIVYIVVRAKDIKDSIQEFEMYATVKEGNKEYTTNEEKGKIIRINQYEAKMSSNSENEYVKAGDVIEYKINLKNNNKIPVETVVRDDIPSDLSIADVKVNGVTVEGITNELSIPVSMASEEEKEITIETIVNKQEGMKQDEEILNRATLYALEEQIETNKVSHKMMAGGEGTGETIYRDADGNVITTYKINGIAWEDENKDGQRNDEEKILPGIKARLLNVATNELATNPNGETIEATTGENGEYTLTGIPVGNYVVVFDYDAASYRVADYQKDGVDASRSSNVISKKMSINGEDKTYAVTDDIAITDTSIANVNIGLVKSEKFDLQLDKFVSKVIVQTASDTKTYNYNEEKLAKIELASKEMAGANVIIEYKIKLTNVGEVEGYVKSIADYLPKDLTFSSELNNQWYQEGTSLYNTSLTNQKLSPGESKEVTITATKKMTEDNTGLINNLAEIQKDYNEAGITDVNSTPGNRQQGENDLSSADVIISVKTGGPILYITLTITLLIVLAAGIYFIKKETNLKKDEII